METRRVELVDSGVIFNEEEHSYHLNGKELSGITEMLSRQFGFGYDNVSKRILQQAAEYGTGVHKSCEDFDMNWINDGTVEVQDYINICKENGLVHEASEHTVTDGENWASKIDKIFRVSDDTFSIGDIKTYGVMTPQKLLKSQWQLSIYKTFLLDMMPKAKVDKLFIIHIRNKQKKDGTFDHISKIIFVDAIPCEICKELLDCDLRGEKFKNPYEVPEDICSQEAEIRELIETKNAAEERLAAIKVNILSKMEALDIKTWATKTMKLTRKLPSTRSSFNMSLFRAEHPDIDYAPYERLSPVASSLMITV